MLRGPTVAPARAGYGKTVLSPALFPAGELRSVFQPMSHRRAQTPLDPAADAALLLRRIGFGTLALVLPIASLVSRRAAVVLAPIGVVLLVIAALIEDPRGFGATLRRSLLSLPGMILIGLAGWAALSLVWSPFTASATEKAGNLVLAVVLGFCGNAALPERMRASNLNLAALGTGIAGAFALALIVIAALRHADTDAGVERGISVILIMAWPALAWLLSRERGLSAVRACTRRRPARADALRGRRSRRDDLRGRRLRGRQRRSRRPRASSPRSSPG